MVVVRGEANGLETRGEVSGVGMRGGRGDDGPDRRRGDLVTLRFATTPFTRTHVHVNKHIALACTPWCSLYISIPEESGERARSR